MTPHDALAQLVAAVEEIKTATALVTASRDHLIEARDDLQAALGAGHESARGGAMRHDSQISSPGLAGVRAPGDKPAQEMPVENRESGPLADLRARLDANRCERCADHSSGVAYCVNCGRPFAWRDGEEMSDRLWPSCGHISAPTCARCYADRGNALDALRSNEANLIAALKQAQDTIRQREAAQRAAEERLTKIEQCGPTPCPYETEHELARTITDLRARLEAQTQAAFVAQEAQIAQGWKLHEAEEKIRTVIERAAAIVENVPHSCVSDEHCCALHQAHKRAAAEIRALAVRTDEP